MLSTLLPLGNIIGLTGLRPALHEKYLETTVYFDLALYKLKLTWLDLIMYQEG